MRRRSFGPGAWLIDEIEDPAMWASTLRTTAHPAITEVVPAHESVLVCCIRTQRLEVGATLDELAARPSGSESEPPVTLAVRYDGDDLTAVAEAVGLGVDDVVALHVNATFRVAFCGFSPGFAYLTGLPERLQIPRRADPRPSVPAGAVAIAGEYSCVYPSSSPGGWHLLGATDAVVWDVTASPPAVLRPGRTVRFRAVRA